MFDERCGVIAGDRDVEVAVGGAHVGVGLGVGWQEIDRQVRRLARRRATLDAEEARLLIAAKAAEVHRHLGYGSFDEYLERVLGYAPRTARERMRVAMALEDLPQIAAELEAGTVTFSAVREITRVATAATERAWLDEIDGLTAREIEECVRGRGPGDHPDERPDPQLEPRVLRLELAPEVYGLFLDARRAVEADVGHAMTDSEFMAVACRAARDGAAVEEQQGVVGSAPASTVTDTTARATDNTPAHQIALTVCVDCKRGWQDTEGRTIEVSAAVMDAAQCDATVLGRVDGAAPEPVQRSIPAAVRRMVLARDHHRCQVPGCRSARFVDVHHLHRRVDGGDHLARNLLTLCSLHHLHVHAGRIVIDGVPGALRVTHADGRPYGVRPEKLPVAATARTNGGGNSEARDACEALVTLGFGVQEARAAVATAVAHVGDGPLEVVLRAALRCVGR